MILYILCVIDTGMQKVQNLGSYVLEAQGSRKHEDEFPNRPENQYQAWHNTLTPFQSSKEIQWNCKDLPVIRDHNGTTSSVSISTAIIQLTSFTC